MSNARDEERRTYLEKKRVEILATIKAKCEAFDIKEYDYLVTEDLREYLVLEGQKICCSGNSVWGVEQELIGYIFVTRWEHFDRCFRSLRGC
jgi:hypothetical protein